MSKRTYLALQRALVAIVLLGITYTAARLAQSQRYPGLELFLTAEATILESQVGDSSTDFLTDLRLVAVNETPIDSSRAVSRATRPGLNELLVQRSSGDSAQRVWWLFSSGMPSFVVGPDRQLIDPTSLDLEALGLGIDVRLSSIDGQAVESPASYRELAAQQRGELTRFTFETPSSPVPTEVVIQRLDWRIHWTQFALGVGFGLIGLGAFQLRPDTRSGWAFMLFAVFLANFWFLRAIPFVSKLAIESQVYLLARCFIFLPTLYFLAVFSPLRRVIGQTRWAILIGLALGTGFYLGNFLIAPSWAAQGVLVMPLGVAWSLLVLLVLIVSLLTDALIRLSGRHLPALDRQRGHAFRIAFFAGFVPFALYTIVRIVSGDRFAEARLFFEIAILLFPIILAYATVRHNLLQLNELLLETLVYGGILVALSAFYAVSVGGIVPLVNQFVPGNSTPIAFIAVAVMTVMAAPIHNLVRRALNEHLERKSIDLETIVSDLDVRTASISSPQVFCDDLASKVSDVVGTPAVSILIRHPPTDAWWLATSTCNRESGPILDNCDAFLRVVTERRSELARDILDEDLAATRTEDEIIRGMLELRAALAFPLVVGGELWGVLTVGEKASQRNYSLSEVRVLRRVSRECALGLYQLHLRLAVPGDHAPGPVFRASERIPDRIGSYEIERLLDEGAQAWVYLAAKDGDQVAIKVPNHKLQYDPTLRRRFQRETGILRQLDHPNVVPVVEVSTENEEQPYLVMKYFPQGSLRDRLQRDRRLTEGVAVGFAIDAARGLGAAQEVGVVHRDINPRNILLSNGNACVGDFGIALWDWGDTLTTHSHMLGTPGYLSPEVCAGKKPDWRADQYGLGITLYESLAGHRPYRGASVMEIATMHLHAEIPDVRSARPDVSLTTASAIQRMMAKSPEDRFDSYQQLIEGLREDST